MGKNRHQLPSFFLREICMSDTGVMVVEDEAVVRLDIRKTLQNLHYQILCEAGNGDEAVEKAREFRPDVILMDIKIPGTMDGVGAARVIREELGIPVIFVTAWTDDATLSQVKETNPYGYIAKPFRDQDIRIAVELAVSRKTSELQGLFRIPDLIEEQSAGPAGTGPDASISNIRALFVKGFFQDLALLVYSNAAIKEQVFTTFIERNLAGRGEILFAYSLSRSHRNFLPEIQNGKIRICRIKGSSLSPLKEVLRGIPHTPGTTDPVPLKILIDFSGEYDPADIRAVVNQVIAVRQAGAPVSGIIALDTSTGDETLIHDISQMIPGIVAATSSGMLISCADQSFPLESLSFLPQGVVDETVKKVLEPVVLSLLQKPISGQTILQEIRGRYNLNVPKARVYMQLYDLQKKGYLVVRTMGKSKVYSPTETGKKHIRQKLGEFKSAFHHILSEMADRESVTGFPERKE